MAVSAIPSVAQTQALGIGQVLGPYAPITPVAPVTPSNAGNNNQQNKFDSRPRFAASAFLAQLLAQSDEPASLAPAAAASAYGTDDPAADGQQQASQTQQDAAPQDQPATAAVVAQFIAGAVPPTLANQAISLYERTQARGRPAANSNEIVTPNLGPTADGATHIVDLVA